jgi:E3 ubiquitin-protein ligase DOA10
MKFNNNSKFKSKAKSLVAPIGVRTCRICLGEDSEPENLLISPCKCSGTMKFIHVKCLQEWLNGKKTIRELPHSTIYVFRIS